MDSSKMYVPDPQKWVKYYESMAKGNHNPYIDRKGRNVKQIGGSLTGSHGTFMVPIDETSNPSNKQPTNSLAVQLVSPSQQVVDQAKSELQINKNVIKRRRPRRSASLPKRLRTVKTLKRSKRKNNVKRSTRKIANKKKVIRKLSVRKTKAKKQKRKINKKIKQYMDIFA
ncbi:unnamed protein product [Mytilus coruscus]|uniref:Uncharacterized protein n=1 Tax=Mytilus coruscus TaxID=42192 RepID=A0A6J8E881_MYTCO|nr:unnamed protein product [Mytilus coruscus]